MMFMNVALQVSPPSGSCVWSSKSVRDFNDSISRLNFYEPVTIRPISSVRDALVFVNLYKKSSKIKQNHEGNLDITQELNRLESVKVVQSNRNAISSLKYLCYSEDKKRRFRGEMFLKKIRIFNSLETLKKQIESFEKGKNDYSYPEVVLIKSCKSSLNSEKKILENQQDFKFDHPPESPAKDVSKPICDNGKNSMPIINNAEVFTVNECKESSYSDLCKVENENIDSKDLIIFSETVSLMESYQSYSTNNCGPYNDKQISIHEDACASQSLKELVMIPFQDSECDCVEKQSKAVENMCLKCATISVTDNEFQVLISHIESPSRFWVLCGEDGQARLTKLNEDMNDRLKCFEGIEKLKPMNIRIGTVCLVILKESIFDDQLKYRSLVILLNMF